MVKGGNEIKVVYPQIGAMPELFEGLQFHNYYLQPMDGPDVTKHIAGY